MMENKYKYLLLCTPQHTGTWFMLHLLQMNPDISYCMPIDDQRKVKLLNLFLYGKNNLSPYVWWSGLLDISGGWGASYFQKQKEFCEENNYKPEKKDGSVKSKFDQYRFSHFHVPANTDNLEWQYNPNVKAITTVRDPILCVLSALYRTTIGHGVAEVIIKAIAFMRDIDCFKVCIDLHDAGNSRMYEMYDYLGLEPSDTEKEYLENYPVVNTAKRHKVPAKSPSGEKEKFSREQIIEMEEWYREGKMHPLLGQYWSLIHYYNLEPYYKSLGYKNLPWMLDKEIPNQEYSI